MYSNNISDFPVVLLVCLNMSIASDTINYNILLQQLPERCGINGVILK